MLTFEQRQFIKREISRLKKKKIRRDINLSSGKTGGAHKTRERARVRWAEEQLVEVDPRDPHSDLRCLECGRVSNRRRRARHYIYCKFYEREQRTRQTQKAA